MKSIIFTSLSLIVALPAMAGNKLSPRNQQVFLGACEGTAVTSYDRNGVYLEVYDSICSHVSISGKRYAMDRVGSTYSLSEYIPRKEYRQKLHVQAHSASWQTTHNFKLVVPARVHNYDPDYDCPDQVTEVHHHYDSSPHYESHVVYESAPVYIKTRSHHRHYRKVKHRPRYKHHRVRVHHPRIQIRTEIPPFRVKIGL
ncbi:MAG: hypothetical protein HRU19_22365 [Pseudobacteriovorax sp.]|nr:hypothetical protein [Pseudobacteriovorax sp.]